MIVSTKGTLCLDRSQKGSCGVAAVGGLSGATPAGAQEVYAPLAGVAITFMHPGGGDRSAAGRPMGYHALMACRSPLLLLPMLLAPSIEGPAQEPAKAPPSGQGGSERPPFQQVVRPFLDQHCTGCHGGEKPKAGISFESRGE